MERKGQSALEYLMTYGWALVTVVIVVAALFAFGIFNPSELPEQEFVEEWVCQKEEIVGWKYIGNTLDWSEDAVCFEMIPAEIYDDISGKYLRTSRCVDGKEPIKECVEFVWTKKKVIE